MVDELLADPREQDQPRWSPDASPADGGPPATHRRQELKSVDGGRGAGVSGCIPP